MRRGFPIKIILAVVVLAVSATGAVRICAQGKPTKLRIIYTGDMMGYWQPCGCHGQKGGGLARRATAIPQFTKDSPNTVIVDSGNLSDMSAKLDVIDSVLAQLKYDAVGIGKADVQMGADFYSKAKDHKLTVLDASPCADMSTVPYVIKDAGGVKVGIISFGALRSDAQVNEYELRKARFAAYKEARDKSDVLIVLDQSNTVTNEWLDRNAARLGAPDIVIAGVQRASQQSEEVVGNTHIMPSLPQAKEMGVIDIDFTRGESPRVALTRVGIDEKFAEDAEVGKRVGAAVLKIGGTMTTPVPAVTVSNINPNVKPYYSPLLCKACHEKQYQDWSQTKHARALKTLVDGKNTTPDCLPCHSEVFRASQRYIPVDQQNAGVECATCHMNALPHGLERKDMAVRSKVDPKTCLECHTKDHSPTYDVKTYFPRVVHAGTTPTTTASATK